MSRPTLAEIENAFQPAREVDDAQRFAGRKAAVSDANLALLGTGTNIGVVGNRGIGKTSLARQVALLASGNDSLLDRLGIAHDRPMDYLAVYFACGKTVKSVDDLLEKLLTTSACLGDCAYKLALDDGVDNSSQYVGQLVTEEYGAELEKVRERYYRFNDSLFAAYCLARPRQLSVGSE